MVVVNYETFWIDQSSRILNSSTPLSVSPHVEEVSLILSQIQSKVLSSNDTVGIYSGSSDLPSVVHLTYACLSYLLTE